MNRMLRSLTILLLLLTAPIASAEIADPWTWLDSEAGSRFTPHHRIIGYFEYLAENSARLSLHNYGETWEKRPLLLAVVGSPSNVARADEIRARLDRLSDPRRTSRDEARRIAQTTPAVVWLAYGVHGNESSSAEAAMVTAHWLVTEAPDEVLDNVVVLIDPLQNPDGRERYVNWFHQKLGQRPNPSLDAVEHREPWPGGRFNHYLVDMNRDWAWATQPETRGRIVVFRDWNPQVVVDLHEMWHDSTYFFPPVASPVNPNIDPGVVSWLETFGRENARVFSERGWPFFIGEYFDLFYPGYGDSWPSLRGAIGMTYEVAGHSRAGVLVDRRDGTTWSLAERIEQHHIAAQTTVLTAASNSSGLLMHTWSAASSAMQSPSTFFLIDGSPAFDEAIDLLVTQGVEVGYLASPVTTRATRIGRTVRQQKSFPAGTAVVSTAQPLGALARTLLEQNPALAPEFVEKQRERVDADEHAEFYDLTGWSIPLAFNVETWQIDGTPEQRAVETFRRRPAPEFHSASYGWIVDGMDPAVYRTAAALLRHGVRFGVTSTSATMDETEISRGSLVVLRFKNIEGLEPLLRSLAESEQVRFIPVHDGMAGDLSLGSGSIRTFIDPQILLVGGDGTSSTSFGSLWYTLDVEVELPHTVIDLDHLGRINLSRYRVIVLPDGYGYGEVLDETLRARLREWVSRGGTIVAVKRAAAALRAGEEKLSEIEPRAATPDDEAEVEPGQKRYTEHAIPGAAFATNVRRRDHLSFGIPASSPMVLLEGSVALELAPYAAANIVTIDGDTPLVAGLAWPESVEKIKGSPWLASERIGAGRVITFADEPHYRLFWKGTLPFFLNAVMHTPSFIN
jgi:hypothetical protein